MEFPYLNSLPTKSSILFSRTLYSRYNRRNQYKNNNPTFLEKQFIIITNQQYPPIVVFNKPA